MRLGHARAIVAGHTDHLPAHSVHPPGVLVLRRHWNPDDEWWEIRRADPHLKFSQPLLDNVANGFEPNINNGIVYPCMTLDRSTHSCPWHRDDPGVCHAGEILHIECRDEKAIYRIDTYIVSRDEWVARFLD